MEQWLSGSDGDFRWKRWKGFRPWTVHNDGNWPKWYCVVTNVTRAGTKGWFSSDRSYLPCECPSCLTIRPSCKPTNSPPPCKCVQPCLCLVGQSIYPILPTVSPLNLTVGLPNCPGKVWRQLRYLDISINVEISHLCMLAESFLLFNYAWNFLETSYILCD